MSQPRTTGGRFAPKPAGIESLEAAEALIQNPKALELAQKLAKVEGELAAKQAQYNAQGVLYSNVRVQCENLKRELREEADKAREYKGQRDALQQLLTNAEDSAKGWEQTASTRQSRIEDLEFQVKGWKARTAEAQAHAANLQEGNTRLCNDLSLAQQGRDALQVERDQVRAEVHRLRDEARGSLLASLFLMAIGGCGGALAAWLVRGWLHG